MTVVLDTNVLVAALVAEGLCREVVHRAARMRVLASSADLLDELDATLRRKFRITPPTATFLETLRRQIRLVEAQSLREPVCRDQDDDLVLATAVAASADIIVTGDQDLLIPRVFEGIAVMSPRQFLERLDSTSP